MSTQAQNLSLELEDLQIEDIQIEEIVPMELNEDAQGGPENLASSFFNSTCASTVVMEE